VTFPLLIEASAKINLALVVGPRRPDGLHEVASVVQRVGLSDRVQLEAATELDVEGYDGDTVVRDALRSLAVAAGVEPRWRVRLDKAIPVAAGLGGGSADAGAALVLANRTLAAPLAGSELVRVAAAIGSDVPFFLDPGPKLVEGRGERLTPLRLPQEYWVVLAIDADAVKESTGAVYARFDELGLEPGFAERRAGLMRAIDDCRAPHDLARFPPNDLGEVLRGSPLLPLFARVGAFRADVSGAGPTVYGLFLARSEAEAAVRELPPRTRSWIVSPVW
jgi:4-diphosphocytidyl-2-C-methyl-D-erythritol kinase